MVAATPLGTLEQLYTQGQRGAQHEPAGIERVVEVRMVAADVQRARHGACGEVQDHGHDVYGRYIGRLIMDGDDLGAEMVRTGMAWAYRYRAGAGPYAKLQKRAQEDKRGLFGASETAMTPAVSTMRFEKPHSLSYQLTTRASLPSITLVSRESTVEDAG